jgi:hypothetical protein
VLSIVRNNSPYTAILIFVFAILLHLQGMMHASLPMATEGQFGYAWLLWFLSFLLGKSALAFSIFSVILISIQAIWLNSIVAQHKLFLHNTYIVSFSFVALSSLNPSLSSFSPLLVVNFLVILTLRELLQLKNAQKVSKELFNIGFWVMLAAILHFSAVFLVLFSLFAVALLRPFVFKEWMIVLAGLFMPLYFLLVILFCTDKLYLMGQWPQLGISLPRQVSSAYYFLGLLVGLIIWMFLALFNMQTQLPKAPIYIRRCWISITFLMIVSFFIAVFSDYHVIAVASICLPALSLILSHAFLNEQSKKMNTISFYFALALVLFCQIFLPS